MKKAFTLVELFVVIAIIGILAAIVIPSVSAVRNSQKKKAWSPNQVQTQTVEYKRVVIDGKTYKLVPE